MTSDSGDLSGCSLLAIFAHPDDESLACGGLLAWCAHLGVRVSLLCATHGEAGPTGGSAGLQSKTRPTTPGADHLAVIRAQELEAAARVLGVAEIVLLDHADGWLPWVDEGVLEADIRAAIERIHPDVVITFGEDGLYWHPDHIAIHEKTTAVVESLGEAAPALYYVTMPPGRMRALVETVAARVNDGRSHSQVLGIDDPDAFGALAAPPTLIVEASEFAALKLAALRCHRAQIGEGALAFVTDADAKRLLGTEHFRRAAVGAAGDSFIERFADNARGGGPSGRGSSEPSRSRSGGPSGPPGSS